MNALREAFAEQAEHCDALGSPFMGRLMRLCAANWPESGAVARRAMEWPGDLGPKADSLPLRLAGGLHALVLRKTEPALVPLYPPNEVSDISLWAGVRAALEDHEAFLLDWIGSPPQTNEVRRAAALIPVAHMLAERYGLPLCLSELGASGGLNLNFDQFRLVVKDRPFGPHSAVVLKPEWHGPCPPPSHLSISGRRGVDLAPLNPAVETDAIRLLAYLWPDQLDRLARTRAAMTLAPAPIDKGCAVDWLAGRLVAMPGHTHLIYSTIAWQYIPAERRRAGQAMIEVAGARASASAPLAWLRMEADAQSPGAALSLRLWPGDHAISLARVDFHGRWIDWTGPAHLR